MANFLHIITRLDMGGSAQNTLSTCRGLVRSEYRVVLASGFSHESNMTAKERRIVTMNVNAAIEEGVDARTLPTLVRRIDPPRDFVTFLLILRLIRKVKPQIVHTHSSKAGILGRLAAWLLGVPCIIHTPHGHVFHGHFSRRLSKMFLIVERIFDKFTDCTIALTEGERTDYIRLSVSRPHKLVKIHSGVDVQRFIRPPVIAQKKRKTLGITPEERVVGTVGWLLPIKGPDYLLEAMGQVWQTHPDVKLMFVGKGDLETELKARADAMGVRDRVIFLGWRDDVHEILPVFDIFVLPSLNEGMGRVIVEAMAAGKPVIASRTGGIPDLVTEGETGFLVKPRDVEGLSKALKRLLDNPDLRHVMGRAGRQRCHLFSETSMMEKLDALYSRLLTAC